MKEQDKKKAYQVYKIVMRVVVAAVLAIPFIFFSFGIILMSLWNGGIRHPDVNASGQSFVIINKASVPFHVSVHAAYTPRELENLRQRDIDIDLQQNFVTYQDTLISNEGMARIKQFAFTIPIPTFRVDVAWPSELLIKLTVSPEEGELWFRPADIDSTMRARMEIVVTDSLLQAYPKTFSKSHHSLQEKGGCR